MSTTDDTQFDDFAGVATSFDDPTFMDADKRMPGDMFGDTVPETSSRSLALGDRSAEVGDGGGDEQSAELRKKKARKKRSEARANAQPPPEESQQTTAAKTKKTTRKAARGGRKKGTTSTEQTAD